MTTSYWSHATKHKHYLALPRDSARRVYVRIMQAAYDGRGVSLTREEVESVAADEMIAAAAVCVMEGEYGRRHG